MNSICVLGSINMDVVLKVNRMAKVGETIFATGLNNIPGGKGGNQAVACSRLGGNVYMISKVGVDGNGELLVKELIKDNINVDFVFKDEKYPTGTAIITVDDEANNSIIVASGANMCIDKSEIIKATEAIKESDIIISQFETPIEATIEAFKIAKENEKITILNPAPAKDIHEELFKYTDIIVPNETEAYELTGIEVKDLQDAKKATEKLIEKGVKCAIITLGAKGAAIVTTENAEIIPAYKVKAVDTTAAGDSFIGGFASMLDVKKATEKLIEKGVKCAIITLGAKGAAIVTTENAEIIPAYKVKAVDTTAAGDSFIGGFASMLDVKKVNFESIRNAVRFGNEVSAIAVQIEGAQPSIPYLKEVKEIYEEA